MARYSADMNKATSSTTLAVGAIYCPGSGQRRVKLYDITFGSEAVAADNAIMWQLNRSTTAPTATSFTPVALDPADAACVTLCGENVTVQGTNTASAFLLSVPLNQRATFRWVAAPGGEFVIPATASNGVHFNTPTTTNTPALTVNCHFEEQ